MGRTQFMTFNNRVRLTKFDYFCFKFSINYILISLLEKNMRKKYFRGVYGEKSSLLRPIAPRLRWGNFDAVFIQSWWPKCNENVGNAKGLLNFSFMSSETFPDMYCPWRVKQGKIVIFTPHCTLIAMGSLQPSKLLSGDPNLWEIPGC
jgi:hypothetical protein